MEAYTDFASVYDIFMDQTPYSEWADFLADTIEKYGISKPEAGKDGLAFTADGVEAGEILRSERNLVLDLGCGTGTLTELLYQKGYDMIGVD
ncbi:MAG: class I SAM-dependent methyltransferase, partial [Lachnospiraceae bacterium]|nr:class I SAM-dependent methyltransferase [Lachnospiraceae bacterium]